MLCAMSGISVMCGPAAGPVMKQLPKVWGSLAGRSHNPAKCNLLSSGVAIWPLAALPLWRAQPAAL